MWVLTLSREVRRVNARTKDPCLGHILGKTFASRALWHRVVARASSTAWILLIITGMTIIPKDSEIAAVVVLLGAVLISGLLRAF
jgi:hypothetical protein